MNQTFQPFVKSTQQTSIRDRSPQSDDKFKYTLNFNQYDYQESDNRSKQSISKVNKKLINDDIHQDLNKYTQEVKKDFKNIFNTSGFDRDSIESSNRDSKQKTFNTARLSPKSNANNELKLPSLNSRKRNVEQLTFNMNMNTLRNGESQPQSTRTSQFNETLNNIGQMQAKISFNQFDTSIIEPEKTQPPAVLSNLNAQHVKIRKNIKKLTNRNSKQRLKESSKDLSPKQEAKKSKSPAESKKHIQHTLNEMQNPSIRQYSQKQLMSLKEEQEKRIKMGHSISASNENTTNDFNNTNGASTANREMGLDASMIHLRVIQFSDSGDSRSSSEQVNPQKQKFVTPKTLQGRGYINRNDMPSTINQQVFEHQDQDQPIQNIVIKSTNRKRVNKTPFIKELQSNHINLPGLNTVNDFVNAQSSRDLNQNLYNTDSLQSIQSSQEGSKNTAKHFRQRHNSHMINTSGAIHNINNRAHITSIQYLNNSASGRTVVESLGQESTSNLQASSRGDLTRNFLKENKSLKAQTSVNRITNVELDNCIKKISKIHSKLMEKRDTKFSTQNMMTQLECLIPNRSVQQLKTMKQTTPARYLDKTDLTIKTPQLINNKGIFKLLTPLESLNKLCNETLIPQLSSIRASLCGPLQEVIECFNCLFLLQFQEFARYTQDKDERIDLFLDELESYHNEVTEEKERLVQWKQNVTTIIQSREKDCRVSEDQLKSLEQEVSKLRKVIEDDKSLTEGLKNQIKEKTEVAEMSLAAKVNMVDKYEAKKRMQLQKADYADSAKHIYDPTNIPQLNESVKLAQKSFDIRDDLLKDIDGLIKNMIMSRAKQSVKCQTDEAVWNAIPNILRYEYEQFEESDMSEEEKRFSIAMGTGESEAVSQFKETQQEIRQEQKYIELKVKHGILKPNQKRKSSIKISEQSQQEEESVKSDKLTLKKRRTSKLPIQTPEGFDELRDPQTSYNMSLRQQGFMSVNQMKQKHTFLIGMFRKTKQAINKKDDNPLDQKGGITLKQPTGIIEWVIPYPIITFCANHIGKLQEMQEEMSEGDFYSKLSDLLVPWTRFKQLIFQIYDNRINASSELNGGTNNTYCHMSEFILVYFMKELMVREKAEQECIIFILNLYYYFDLWHRARNMVYNLQFVKIETSQQRFDRQKKELDQTKDKYGDLDYVEVTQGYLRDNNVPDNDIYTQEFFLLAYNMITREPEKLIESQEGNTYISYPDHNPPVRRVLTKFRGVIRNNQRMNDWAKRIEPHIFKFSVKEGDEARDHLDLDIVLQELMNEFKETRALFQKQLKEYFVDHCNAMEAIMDLEKFNNVLMNQTKIWGESEVIDGLIQFPQSFSAIRAFIFAATACRTNQTDIHVENFLAALSRFGLENPIPTVTHRLAYFGVHEDVLTLLKQAQRRLDNNKKRTVYLNQQKTVLEDDREVEFDVEAFLGNKYHDKQPLAKKNALKKSRYSEIYQHLQIDNQIDAEETKGVKPLRHDSEAQVRKTSQKEMGFEDKKTFFLAGNCNFKIEDIKQVEKEDYDHLEDQRQSPTAKAAVLAKMGIDSLHLKKQLNSAPARTVEKEAMTIIQPTVHQHNKIIVPSFQTTGKIFAAHLEILRDLRKQTKILKQAYFNQMDKDRSWQQVDQILVILKNAEKFLDETITSNIEEMQNDLPQVNDILDEVQKKQYKQLTNRKSNDFKGANTPSKSDLPQIEEMPDEGLESPNLSRNSGRIGEIKSQD